MDGYGIAADAMKLYTYPVISTMEGACIMAYTDKFLEEYSQYRPELTKRADFDAFWRETLAESAARPLNASVQPYDYPSPYAAVYDIAYDGFDGTRIHGWYIVPVFLRQEKYPCLVHYHGFTGNRGTPADFMQWLVLGVAVVSVDVRGQCGNTGDRQAYSSGTVQSVVTHGILDKNEYYFRFAYMDCVRALDFACMQREVDVSRLIVEGGSQGGALTMAVAALDPRPCLALADVPSNSNLEERVKNENGSFTAVTDYLRAFPHHTERTFETLSYFDTMNLADRIRCRVLASAGLKDNVCPARLYFATYNRITAPKEIRLYPFNGHEGGGVIHNEVKLRFVRENI